jgi:hypothetical protein
MRRHSCHPEKSLAAWWTDMIYSSDLGECIITASILEVG